MFELNGSRHSKLAEGCKCMLGLVVWCPRSDLFIIFAYEALFLAFGVKLQYIGQAEIAAAAAAYWTCGEELKDSYPIHFVDNKGGLASLVRGSSRDAPSSWLVHDVARQHFYIDSRVWFEFVPSAARTLLTSPSGGEFKHAARIIRQRFGKPVYTRRMILPALRPCDYM